MISENSNFSIKTLTLLKEIVSNKIFMRHENLGSIKVEILKNSVL